MNLIDGEVSETGETTGLTLAGGGRLRANIPTRAADRGMVLRIGIRPEDLVPVADGAGAAFTGRVTMTEALGEVTLLYLSGPGSAAPVVAKLPGIHAGLRHSAVALTADPARVHLFHQGRSLLYR